MSDEILFPARNNTISIGYIIPKWFSDIFVRTLLPIITEK